MDMATDIVTWACVIAGSVMALIGAVGMIRLPDVFQRMHAAGIIDTLGVGLILGGLIFQAGWSAVTIKLSSLRWTSNAGVISCQPARTASLAAHSRP